MKSFFKTTLLMGVLVGLFLGIGYFLAGRTGAAIALVVATVMNVGMFWFSDKLVLKMQRAKPLDTKAYPQIDRYVTELAEADGLAKPKLYFVDSPIPNAFATGRSHKHSVVAVTRGIVELLDDRELKAVLAHEIGHIKNRDMLVSTIAATVAGAISMLVEIAFWGGALFGGGDEDNNWLGSLALMLFAPLAAVMVQMAVSRSREFMADAHSAEVIGHGNDLASALQKLDGFKRSAPRLRPTPQQEATAHLQFMNMFSMQGIASLFSTHPSTEARVKRLEQYK